MTAAPALPDPTTEAGRAIVQRLEHELVAWLTTVTVDGLPQSSAVWFLWSGGEILVYGRLGAPRSRNIATNPRVSLHLNSDAKGDDIVTFEAEARLDQEAPSAAANPPYLAKYHALIVENGWTDEQFAADYPDPIRIRPTRLRLG
jgi:PPOX class probable F420-dependent enzyme